MMRVTLVLEKRNRPSKRINLRWPRTVVGRQQGCHVRIPSAEVSRRHCLFHVGENNVYVEDLKSVNGTYVNEIAVIGREEICPGDRVHIGPLTFVVEFSPLPEDARPAFQGASPDPGQKNETVELEEVEAVEEDIEIVEDPDEIPAGEIILDDDAPLELPESDDLRGILNQLTDSKNPPTQPRKP